MYRTAPAPAKAKIAETDCSQHKRSMKNSAGTD